MTTTFIKFRILPPSRIGSYANEANEQANKLYNNKQTSERGTLFE